MKRAEIQSSLDQFDQLMKSQTPRRIQRIRSSTKSMESSDCDYDCDATSGSEDTDESESCYSDTDKVYAQQRETIDDLEIFSARYKIRKPPEEGPALRLSRFHRSLLMIAVVTIMCLSTVRIENENRVMTSTSTTSTASISGSTARDRARTTSIYLKEYEQAGFSTTLSTTTSATSTISSSSQSLDNVQLSKSLQFLANITTAFNTTSDVPLFFHIPRSGGSTIKDILGMCMGKVEATDVGVRNHRLKLGSEYVLQVVNSDDGAAFVNVDTSTAKGIHRAKRMGLVESRLAEVIVSQHLHPVSTLFNAEQQGRMFTMIRHPIERAVSMFHYLGVANWEPTYDPSLAYVSIEMYARSQRAEHNWAVRFLSNELVRNVNERHLQMAKEVLKQKCLVGLLEEKSESFHRFSQYFGWQPKTQHQTDCRDRLLNWGWSNKHAHPQVEEGSAVWELLYKKNSLDMELYDFAKELFREQAAMFHTTQKEPKDVDASGDKTIPHHPQGTSSTLKPFLHDQPLRTPTTTTTTTNVDIHNGKPRPFQS